MSHKKGIMNLPKFNEDIINEIKSNLRVLEHPEVNNFIKLEKIYNESKKINEFLASYFSCHCGCYYCCKNDVLVTRFEAEYISWKTGLKVTDKPFSFRNNNYCPFLKDKICSIYEHLPLICRTYHVFGNPENCKVNYENGIGKYVEQYGTEIGMYGNTIFSEFARFIFFVNENMFNGIRKDIRNFF